MHCAYLQLPSLPCTAREVRFGIGEALILVGSCPAETPFRDRSDPIIMMVVPSRQTKSPEHCIRENASTRLMVVPVRTDLGTVQSNLCRRSRTAFNVTSTVAPVSDRIAGHRPVRPASVVIKNTAFNPIATVTFWLMLRMVA